MSRLIHTTGSPTAPGSSAGWNSIPRISTVCVVGALLRPAARAARGSLAGPGRPAQLTPELLGMLEVRRDRGTNFREQFAELRILRRGDQDLVDGIEDGLMIAGLTIHVRAIECCAVHGLERRARLL